MYCLSLLEMHPTRHTSTAVSETTSAVFGCYFYYISRFWGSLPCCACSYKSDDCLILQKESDVTWARIPIHDTILKFSFLAWTNFSFLHFSVLNISILKANFGAWTSRQILWSVYRIYLFKLYVRLQYQFSANRPDFFKLKLTNIWRINNQLDVTYYFIVLLIGSTYFGHYYAHHQELATIILITTLVVSFLDCCRLEVRCD